MRPKLLLVCEQYQPGEKAALGKAILEAGKLLGIKESEIKAQLGSNLIEEELVGKEFSASLTVEPMCSQIGRIIAVGIAAYNKIEIQHIKGLQLERIPQPRSWDDKMREDSIFAIGRVLSGWIQKESINSSKTSGTLPRVQTPLAAKPTADAGFNNSSTTQKPTSAPGVPPPVATKLRPAESLEHLPKKTPGFFDPPMAYGSPHDRQSRDVPPPKKQPGFFDPPTEEEKARTAAAKSAEIRVPPKASEALPSLASPISDTIDLEALETMLKVEVSNSRMQAIIFNWSKDGGLLELRNAGLTKTAGLDGLVPILVGDDVLKDENKIKEVRASLDKMGYKNPYLMQIREFTMLVRMYQILAKERKLVLQLVV